MNQVAQDSAVHRQAHGRASVGLPRLLPGVLAAGLFAGVLCWPGSQGRARAPVPARLTDPAARFLGQLTDKDPATRRQAFAALVRLGPLRCDQTFELQHHRDPEVVRLSFALHAACQRKHGVLPVRSGGVELLPEGDATWSRPAPGAKTSVHVGLRVQNVTTKPILFPVGLHCLIYITPPTIDGTMPGGNSGDGIPKPMPPVLIQPGKSHRVSFDGQLALNKDGSCGFVCHHPPNRWWWSYSDMRPGGYFVVFRCENEKGSGKADPREWVGSVRSEHLAITIR